MSPIPQFTGGNGGEGKPCPEERPPPEERDPKPDVMPDSRPVAMVSQEPDLIPEAEKKQEKTLSEVIVEPPQPEIVPNGCVNQVREGLLH
jgi:hypothetical protein